MATWTRCGSMHHPVNMIKAESNCMAPMVQARSYHAMVSLEQEDKILVAGGVNYVGEETFEDIKVRVFVFVPCGMQLSIKISAWPS